MTKRIMESSDGRRREHTIVDCNSCNKPFWKQSRFIQEGKNNFCNRQCMSDFSSKQIITDCAFCKTKISVKPSRIKQSKSGLVFCSVNCKDKAQAIEFGREELKLPHYKTGIHSYRIKAFKALPNQCSVCGYNIVSVLEVHHKDGNRDNNEIDNLDILCPTHHKEYDLEIRKY